MPELCWNFAILYTTNHINGRSKFIGMWKYIKYFKKLSITLPVKSCHYCNGYLYSWINQLSNTTVWWLDICCLLHRYQLHVLALMAIFRLID